MKFPLIMILLLGFSQAHARAFGSCARQMAPVREDAEVCLSKDDVIERYLCMAPIRNSLHGEEFQGCQNFVKSFEVAWESAEKHEYVHRPKMGLVAVPDPVACRKPMPIWAAKLKKCTSLKGDKAKNTCKQQVAKLMAPQKKVCASSFKRLNAVVSSYEIGLNPRMPAVSEGAATVTLKRERKVPRSAKSSRPKSKPVSPSEP